ncbi:MAG: tRNA-guanine transglycosylase [Promethearchaeota archaeon]
MINLTNINGERIGGRTGKLRLNRQYEVETPLFLPVYQPVRQPISATEMTLLGAQGLIVNAFFLYKNSKLKEKAINQGIHRFLGLGENSLVMTDSGAYQKITGSQEPDISNEEIIVYQEKIKASIITPFDEITFPNDSKNLVLEKAKLNLKRYNEARNLAPKAQIAFVLSTGLFNDIRREYIQMIRDKTINTRYVALGSLVPFFTQKKNFNTLQQILLKNNVLIPEECVIHLMGAGHPQEIPFFIASGCDVFDSSVFHHLARKGIYFLRHGWTHINRLKKGCECPICSGISLKELKKSSLAIAKHNLYICLKAVEETKEAIRKKSLLTYLEEKARGFSYLQDYFNQIIRILG